MTWNVTMLLIHLAVLGALGVLWRHAPDVMQKAVLGLFIGSTMIFMWASVATLARWPDDWIAGAKLLASAVEHLAVIVYVLRLFIADQERRCLPRSSLRSPS